MKNRLTVLALALAAASTLAGALLAFQSDTDAQAASTPALTNQALQPAIAATDLQPAATPAQFQAAAPANGLQPAANAFTINTLDARLN